MQWTDIHDLARALADTYPERDPLRINFVDLRNAVLALPGFAGDPEHCGERILEAIQAAWIEEIS
jgi:FeS assembly protein IscX